MLASLALFSLLFFSLSLVVLGVVASLTGLFLHNWVGRVRWVLMTLGPLAAGIAIAIAVALVIGVVTLARSSPSSPAATPSVTSSPSR